ncbi:hypothetical protein SASPL_139478 [Salvia splendens]|uniref:TRAM domain-containing protein n=1 Tax=Salvia splendens TaxID=180675 RepID=A0A8X8WPT4_SALSN|nr:hypothetical protein SASPL_139478 [Salvia splendens]
MAAAVPSGGVHLLHPRPWLRHLRRTARPISGIAASSRVDHAEELNSTAETPEPPMSRSAEKDTAAYYPKQGQILELVCESLAYKGNGLCMVDGTGFVVMCDRVLPGEKFIGRGTRKKDNYAEVKKLETNRPHWDMVEAPCEYASHCGGCKTQNLLYEAQVRAKEQQVRELVVHVGKFSNKDLDVDDIMKPIVPCDIQFHYRNKVLAFIQEIWRNPEFGLSPYDGHSHRGFLKHFMLRTGWNVETCQPELMVNFVTSSYQPELLKPLVDKISPFPDVVSIINNVNTSVGNKSIQIRTSCTLQAEILYKLIEDCSFLKGDGWEIVLDLFCGTGTIGLTLAKKAKHVYGFEIVDQAIKDACRNADLNGISNATFVQGDLNKNGENFGEYFPKPDLVITDPNRPGMHMKLIKFLLNLKADRIVYVSCNPATCARDLDYLCHGVPEKNIERCYKLKSIQSVDMFPHTPHIECVCLLELN